MSIDTQDDELENSRAPLLDHLSELRSRLVICLVAVVVAFGACFAFAQRIFLFLTEPFVTAVRTVSPGHAGQALHLYNTHAFGFFFVQIQVALFAAIILAFPILAWQAYGFIAPGLYKRERTAVAPFLIASPVMFLVGAAFVFYIVMPFALEFSLRQQVTQGPVQVTFLPRVEDYLGLVTTLTLAFGLCFQMPVVLSLLGRLGLITASALRKGRRYALVGIAAVAACVTPPDVISMTAMFVPLYALYEISIWLVWTMEKARARSEARAAAEPQFRPAE